MLKVCSETPDSVLAASKGHIDADRLLLWQLNESGSEATIWYEDGSGISEVELAWPLPPALDLRFMDAGSAEPLTARHEDIVRIVPSWLRNGRRAAVDAGIDQIQ